MGINRRVIGYFLFLFGGLSAISGITKASETQSSYYWWLGIIATVIFILGIYLAATGD